MGMTSTMLKEDNKQILEAIKQLDKRIIELRKAGKLPPEYIEALTEFYQKATLPWMDRYYTVDKEVDSEEEQQIMDDLYDVFLILQALED